MAKLPPLAAEKERLLKSNEVAALMSISIRTLWRLIADGKAPKPIRYNRKLVRWPESVIQKWLNEETARYESAQRNA